MLLSRVPAAAVAIAISLPMSAIAAEAFVPASGIDGAGIGPAEPAHGRVWLDTAAYFTSEGGVLSPIMGGGIFASERVELELAVPVALTTGDNSDVDIGNPYIGASYVQRGIDARVRAGLRLAAPLADAGGLGFSSSLLAAGVSRGFGTSYLYALEAFGVIPNARLEVDAVDALVLTLDVALPILVRNDTVALLEVAPGIAVRPSDAVVIGVRVPIAVVLAADGSDAQSSVEPFVRGQIGNGFLSARFTYNIDEPLGPSFDDRKLWNVGVGAGFAF